MKLEVTRHDGSKEVVDITLPLTFSELKSSTEKPSQHAMREYYEERAVIAIEKIADALSDLAILTAKRLEKDFPAKHDPRDATITRIPTVDDRLRASQGASDEPIEEWIGSREEEFVKTNSRKKS